MRAAPLAFFLDPRCEADRRTIRDVSRITHHSDEAYVGSLAIVVAIRHCSTLGAVPDALLSTVAAELPDTAVRDRILEIAGSTPEQVASKFGASGHVVDAVPLSLQLVTAHRASSAQVIRAAISLGGDTDTIAALAAQILGATGVEPPADLLARIPATQDALAIFSRAARLAGRAG
jgi:poly(ADP-ribose) glycohydrolase ARH3